MCIIPIATSSGVIDLLNPEYSALDLISLGKQLAQVNRWGGATIAPWSVAQHSGMVVEQLPAEWRPYGLIHDMHESIVGEIPTPAKQAMHLLGGGDALHRLVTALDKAITLTAGLRWPWPAEARAAVDHADAVALVTEARDVVLPSVDTSWTAALPVAPLRRRLHPQTWTTAEADMVTLLRTLLPNTGRIAA